MKKVESAGVDRCRARSIWKRRRRTAIAWRRWRPRARIAGVAHARKWSCPASTICWWSPRRRPGELPTAAVEDVSPGVIAALVELAEGHGQVILRMPGWILESADPPIILRLPGAAVKTVGRTARADFIVEAPLVSRCTAV